MTRKGLNNPEFISKRSVPITTTIPHDKWLEIKKSRMSWNSLILRGWEAHQGFNGLTDRTRANEETVKNLETNIARMQQIIFNLNDKLEKIEGVNKNEGSN
jgi:hypothetical protein